VIVVNPIKVKEQYYASGTLLGVALIPDVRLKPFGID
jgi:hypothetical protein